MKEISNIVVNDHHFMSDYIDEWSIKTETKIFTLQCELNEDNEKLNLFDEYVDKIISDECKK